MTPQPLRTALTAAKQARTRARELLPLNDAEPRARVTPMNQAQAQRSLQSLQRSTPTIGVRDRIRGVRAQSIGNASLHVTSILGEPPQGPTTTRTDFQVCNIPYPRGTPWHVQPQLLQTPPPGDPIHITLQARNAAGRPARLQRIQYGVQSPPGADCIASGLAVTSPTGKVQIPIPQEDINAASGFILAARLLRGVLEIARLGDTPNTPLPLIAATPPTEPEPQPEPEPEPAPTPAQPGFQTLTVLSSPLTEKDFSEVEDWVQNGEEIDDYTQIHEGVYAFRGTIQNTGGRGEVQIEFEVDGQGVSIQVEGEDPERPARTTIPEGGTKSFETNGVPCEGDQDAPVILRVFDTETENNVDLVNGTIVCPPDETQTLRTEPREAEGGHRSIT